MRKGSKHTPETRKKLKVMLLGYKETEKFKHAREKALAKQKGEGAAHYGKKHSLEAKEKMRQAKLKNPTRYWFGRKQPRFQGMSNPNWKGGVTQDHEMERKSSEYREWRRKVFFRDRFTCRVCLARGYVQANHIHHFRSHKELRHEVSNGITLCIPCHKFIFKREHLFIDFFQGILKNELNSVEVSQETTPSQQERLRKALWACVTVSGE